MMTKEPYAYYTVRLNDCDLFGHLNNARYIDYFLNAREDHLKDHYGLQLRDFYANGTSWLVGAHEINYLRPAAYGERVCIQSSLLQATNELLLVEMVMFDEAQTQLKAIMRTKFIPVNVKTGKRENHGRAFMELANTWVIAHVDLAQNLTERIMQLKVAMNGKNKTA